jgi:FkbM family methyltransferase
VTDVSIMRSPMSIGRPLRRAWRKVRTLWPKPRVARRLMHGGYWLLLRPREDSHERRLYLDRTYEPATLQLLDAVLRPGDVMIDIGANLGVMTLHGARRVGASGVVVAIEPHPVHFTRLEGHVALNGLPNVHLVRKAVGAETCVRPIFDFADINIGRASLIGGAGATPVGAVEVMRLDDIMAEAGIGHVRLLKLDIEGFEYEALAGAPACLAKRPIICMEIAAAMPTESGGPYAAHELILATGGYECYRFQKSKHAASPLVPLDDPRRLRAVDNAVYIPRGMRDELPRSLFA